MFTEKNYYAIFMNW